MARKINLDIDINIEDNVWENYSPDETFYADFESIAHKVLGDLYDDLS